jgi:hypothetical protein
VSFMARLEQARSEFDRHRADPWEQILERDLRRTQAISSRALLDLLGVPSTTGTARRLAKAMRSLGWVGIKSRLLMPGGIKDTAIRGWARAVRGDARWDWALPDRNARPAPQAAV